LLGSKINTDGKHEIHKGVTIPSTLMSSTRRLAT
jgi:hypothetical protein